MTQSVPFTLLSENLRQSQDKQSFYDFVKSKFDLNSNSFQLYQKQIDQFVINHDLRWKKKSKFRINHFLTQYDVWLQQDFRLENPSTEMKQKKAFNDCSLRTKRRRIEEIRQAKTKEEIEGAFIQNLRVENSDIDAEIITGLKKVDGRMKELILKVINGMLSEVTKYSSEEALALIIDLKLSKFQYDLLRSQAKERQADIYPPYCKVFETKKECYPLRESISISEKGVKIELQSLLDHTIQRIVNSCDSNLFEELNENELLEATYKWGFDGASGQSLYKQVFQNDSENSTDESIMMISLTPLQLSSASKVLWKNPCPSSTRFCRPIQFEFIKENRVTTVETYRNIQRQIADLEYTEIVSDDKTMSIRHKLHGAMFDGKAITHLTDGSTESCNICDALPTEMNNLELIRSKACKVENYRYGISSLHCWIRFFECIIHIGYKIPIQRRSAYSDEHKKTVKETKTRIQEEFKKEKGIITFLNLDTSFFKKDF